MAKKSAAAPPKRKREDPLANVVGVRAYEDLFALTEELYSLIFKFQARLAATAPVIAPDGDTA